jgi:hypothetical protein
VVQAAAALQQSGLPDNAPVALAPAAFAAAAQAEAKRAQAEAAANPENARLRAAALAATQLADSALQAAAAADEAFASKMLTTLLETLPPTAAGPTLVQIPASSSAPLPLIIPPVTPGSGGGCGGSVC